MKKLFKGFITDKTVGISATIDDTTGFLTAPVNLARPGIQFYYGYELGLEDRQAEKIGVYRPPEEVFKKESIDSFTNLVVTDDHPSAPVDTSNVKSLQIGTVSGVDAVDQLLNGVVTITDSDLIGKIKSGKIEVSVGYSNDLEEKSGEYNGVKYDYVQTNIRANHLAIVDAGRCGSACKITLDHNKESKMIITIDGIQHDVENSMLAQAITKQQATHDAEKEEMAEKLKKSKEEKEDAEKKKDKAEATADALKKEQITDDALNIMVADRAQLISDATKILGDKMLDCNDCPKAIKSAVIDKILGLDVKDKSDDYIQASYDIAVEKAKKTDKTLDSMGNGIVDGETRDCDTIRNDARKKYMKDQLGQEV